MAPRRAADGGPVLSFVSGQKLRASQLQTQDDHLTVLDARISNLGLRPTTSSGSTGTTVGVIRLDNVIWVAGQTYAIEYSGHPNGTADENFRCEVRFNSAGAAGTGDTILVGSQGFIRLGDPFYWKFYVPVGVSGTYSLLLTFARNSGASSHNWFCDTNRITTFAVEPKGPASDTGVDI